MEKAHCGHDCTEFLVQTYDTGELVCIKCGRVDEQETARLVYENGLGESAKAHTAKDHNIANALLLSETVQAGYVSSRNPGLAMMLGRGSRVTDYAGKRIKPQLVDSYKAGLLADPSKGCHVEEDSLTGKSKVKFTRYDLPTLIFIREKAFRRAVNLGLDVVTQTLLAGKLKKIYSSLIMSEISEYAVLVSLLSVKHRLPKEQVSEIEKELAICIEKIRVKLLSGCAPNMSVR